MIFLDVAIPAGILVPVLIAVFGGGGFWVWWRGRKLDPSKIRNIDARTEEIRANVEEKKVDTQTKIYKNAIELSDHLTAQLEAAARREELLQVRITNLQTSFELRIGELQNSLDYERREKLKVMEEVLRLRAQLEEYRRGPGPGGGPR